MFSKFFIERPIFATVLALLFVVAGLVTLNILPVAQLVTFRTLCHQGIVESASRHEN